MPVLVALGVVVALIALRYALGAADRRRLATLRRLEGDDAAWWDGRSDVWRYDKHRWGGWWP